MEPLRTTFLVGLAGLGLGIVTLGAWWFVPHPAGGTGRFLHSMFFDIGLLVGITGGFIVLCLGLVYLVNYFAQPRPHAEPKPKARAA